jgi:glycosyltransferase involved in cell wall biosynthesis
MGKRFLWGVKESVMRIAVFHNLPLYGGAYRTLYEQIKYLSKSHEIYLYTPAQRKSKKHDVEKYCTNVKRFDFSVDNDLPGILSRLIQDLKVFLALPGLHKSIAMEIDYGRYEVVLVHTDIYTESPYILKYLHTPTVYHCHELYRPAYENIFTIEEDLPFYKYYYEKLIRNVRKYIDKQNARKSTVIITSSKYINKKVKRFYEKNAVLCLAGVDEKLFKPTSAGKRHTILFIGGKGKIKGYDIACESVNLIDKKFRPELKVLGYTSDSKYLTNEKELVKEYSKALLTLCTSYNEPFGLVALESMACGTPVLAVNEGGYKETVVDGKTGYLLPRDPKAFAEKISFLIKNPEVLKKMSIASRQQVLKKWRWEYHTKKLERILIDAAKSKM